MNRRRFLKYAGAAVVGTSALGLDYLLTRPINPAQTTTTSAISTLKPTIENLKWTPTRIKNDKIYDGNISFDARNLTSSSSEVKLDFTPVFPPEIPKGAIPPEDPRSYSPGPAGNAVNGISSFSQNITEIKGGKQYSATARAKDQAGNETESNLSIDYVREFENLGRLTGLSITPFYYAWHLPSLWGNVPYTPVLGKYDSRDSQVLDIQVDEITGHGMNTICVEWVGGGDWTVGNFEDNLLQNSRMLKSGDIKWYLCYDPVATGRLKLEKGYANVDDSQNRSTIINDFKQMAYLFAQPSYHVSNDKRPYVFWYLYRALQGNVKSLVEEIRAKYNPYIVGDLVYWQLPDELIHAQEIAQYVDSISSYSMYLSNPDILPQDVFLSEIERRYASWNAYASKVGKQFSPVVMPGFDDRLLRGSGRPILVRSKEFFEKQIELAEKYVSESGQVFVDSFNEGPEGTGVERTTQWADTYLQEIRKLALRNQS